MTHLRTLLDFFASKRMKQFHQGMKFRSVRNVRVHGIVAYGAPFSTCFEAVLPAGEILICDQKPGPKAMWLVPERYKHFEQLFVPEHDRLCPEYGGYAVGCSFRQIGKDFEIVEEKAKV